MIEIDDNNKPYLLFFLSLDIADSTSYKRKEYQKNKCSYTWSIVFKKFFKDLDFLIIKHYKNSSILKDKQKLSKWRIIGDEVVYFALITNISLISEHAKICLNIVKDFNKNNNLKIKATSWLAGFPINNIIIYEDEKKTLFGNRRDLLPYNQKINFLGSSIDTGFRISKFASINKYVLSIDLAYTLMFLEKENKNNYLDFYFDGKKQTKGLKENEYPIVWLSVDKPQELKLEKPNPCNLNELYEWSFQYMKKTNIYLPFIANDNTEYKEYFKPSHNYIKTYNSLISNLKQEFIDMGSEYQEDYNQYEAKELPFKNINNLFNI